MTDPLECDRLEKVERSYASVEALLELAGLLSQLKGSKPPKMEEIQEKGGNDERSTQSPTRGKIAGGSFRGRGSQGFDGSVSSKFGGREK